MQRGLTLVPESEISDWKFDMRAGCDEVQEAGKSSRKELLCNVRNV